MGMHVAQHFLKFACPRCPKEFKLLKVLYYHFLAMHLSEELVVSPTVGDEYDELLRNVLMMFQNGLIVSKHEARCTSVASLHELRLGLKSYRIEQLKILDEYKINLMLPIATIDEESSTTDTCKTFIQKQMAHPVVKLKCLSNEDVATLQEKFKKV
ncbi:uncharacterized protein LOC131288013 [Anopheles ziemanni]|uniref:uncharacterized protein LOC131288013 n=1 Tax=Anopheles ziemanni TaxID=345580 RepID=UPI00265E42B5|nr:uncharacterized protein LOC131288013 [Anopheles ziemanni]